MTGYLASNKYKKTLQLQDGDTYQIKDHRGFVVFEVTEAGDIKRKGRDVKL